MYDLSLSESDNHSRKCKAIAPSCTENEFWNSRIFPSFPGDKKQTFS